jgi:hypothetical protein
MKFCQLLIISIGLLSCKGSHHLVLNNNSSSRSNLENCNNTENNYRAINTSHDRQASNAQMVFVELYYESNCPFSRAFIVDQLVPTFVKLSPSGLFKFILFNFYKNAVTTVLFAFFFTYCCYTFTVSR